MALCGRCHLVLCLLAITAIGCERAPIPATSATNTASGEPIGSENPSTNSVVADAPKQDSVITDVGERFFFGRNLNVKVYEERGKLKYALVRKFQDKELTHSKSTELAKEGGWFIYPESADSVWLFDGVNKLISMRFKEVDGMTQSYAGASTLPSAEALKDVPQVVIDRLPESLRSEPKDK